MAWWVPYVLVAAGTAASYYGESRATDRRARLANAMAEYQSKKAGEGRAAIEGLLAKETPAARAEELDASKRELSQAYASQDRDLTAFERPADFSGRVSKDYKTRRAHGRDETNARLSRAIEQMSAINAPGRRQVEQSRRFGTAATEVDATNRAAANVGGAYQSAIGSTQADPLTSFAGQLLAGLGLAGVGKGGTKPAATRNPVRVTSPGNYGVA